MAFVKCILLSPLKVKTMKYYLICNPTKSPKTTCLSLESCQDKVRGKVKTENNNLRLQNVAQIKGLSPWAAFSLPVFSWGFTFIFLDPYESFDIEIKVSNHLIVGYMIIKIRQWFVWSNCILCYLWIQFGGKYQDTFNVHVEIGLLKILFPCL